MSDLRMLTFIQKPQPTAATHSVHEAADDLAARIRRLSLTNSAAVKQIVEIVDGLLSTFEGGSR